MSPLRDRTSPAPKRNHRSGLYTSIAETDSVLLNVSNMGLLFSCFKFLCAIRPLSSSPLSPQQAPVTPRRCSALPPAEPCQYAVTYRRSLEISREGCAGGLLPSPAGEAQSAARDPFTQLSSR